ncbi:hypothetical protein [Nitrosopumilus spindle-shaped virus]|uniref:Uncharacterized protein n=1 Tax=Nitrosopumilus spindle-shaped virus TaxID=2508184 RepID=A0A514K5B9_9VIRU|nr:hypothetical protein [Nitrosopumilus spindle-shaped virus]
MSNLNFTSALSLLSKELARLANLETIPKFLEVKNPTPLLSALKLMPSSMFLLDFLLVPCKTSSDFILKLKIGFDKSVFPK